MMPRLLLTVLLLGGVWSAPALRAQNQEGAAATHYRIYMILWRGETEVEAGFREYVREKGLPFEFIIRDVAGDPRQLPDLVEEAKRLRPDLVYTWGTPVTLGVVGEYDKVDVVRHITDIPVVFTMVSDPVGSRIVPNLESSGRNITGTSHIAPLETQLRAMRAYRPLSRLAVLYNPAEPNSVLNVRQLRALAQQADFDLLDQPVPLDEQGDPIATNLAELVAGLAAREPQFLYMGPDTFISINRMLITSEAIRHRLPVFTATERAIRDGDALFGLVTPYHHLGHFTALKAEQILLEKKEPKSIPIETLSRFTYIVKMPVARELAIYPPMTILNYAEVLQ